jgi:hypothetical protein
MTLGEKQRAFLPKLAQLIQYAYENGYELTLGDAYRDPRLHGAIGEKLGYGHAKSCHKLRLAIDLNIFKGGNYLTDGSGHDELHTFWDSLGGAPRLEADMNHYSIGHEGMR